MRRREGVGRAVTVAVCLAAALALSPPSSGEATAGAADLLAGRYAFHPHPEVTLAWPLRWDEDPLQDPNWQFQLHSLRWAELLWSAYDQTGDERYRRRYVDVLRSWSTNNPRRGPPSRFSWNDHATAFRASVYARAASRLDEPWLERALRLHGRTLADPEFYVSEGNHALNQATGLLDVGCEIGRSDWVETAGERISTLLASSVDAQGATDEQAVEYQLYNLERYGVAREALVRCGSAVPAVFARLREMPELLAHATLPDGTYAMLGDTERRRPRPTPGGPDEYAATAGARGVRPASTSALYNAGFAFGRTGWGDARDFADEQHYSLRFGPGRRHHGHLDHGSLTYYGFGEQLLLDRGKYAYVPDALRDHVTGRSAHNVVTVDGGRWDETATSELEAYASDHIRDHHVVRSDGYPGVRGTRRVVFSKASGVLVVHDVYTAAQPRTFRQLWQLHPAARPRVERRVTSARRDRGNLAIHQLVGDPQVRVVTGQTAPLLGWQTWGYGERVPAPTVEATQSGHEVIFLTLLASGAGVPDVEVVEAAADRDGFQLVVVSGGRHEIFVAEGDQARVTAARRSTFTEMSPSRREERADP